MKDKITLACITIISIAVMEIVALIMGHNGQLLLTTIAAIAAIGAGISGYELKSVRG